MPTARKHQVDLATTPYYHVYSRCVRRAFLCGRDALTGRDFSHRRDLIEDRLALLCTMFTIEVCAFALLANHLHLVLSIDAPSARRLTDQQVVERWGRLFTIPDFVTQYLETGEVTGAEPAAWIEARRERLSDLSWFMRCLKEHVARQANREDECKGRFWETRFHCNALTNHKALLTAMAYVDLNPIRAGTASTPESSQHTSVQLRCREAAGEPNRRVPLKAFAGHSAQKRKDALPMRLGDYLRLVEWTGRALIEGKGVVPPHIPPILDRIGHDQQSWFHAIKLLGTRRYAVIGPVNDLRLWARRVGQKFLHGVGQYRSAFG